jgi:hypothetical protein
VSSEGGYCIGWLCGSNYPQWWGTRPIPVRPNQGGSQVATVPMSRRIGFTSASPEAPMTHDLLAWFVHTHQNAVLLTGVSANGLHE